MKSEVPKKLVKLTRFLALRPPQHWKANVNLSSRLYWFIWWIFPPFQNLFLNKLNYLAAVFRWLSTKRSGNEMERRSSNRNWGRCHYCAIHTSAEENQWDYSHLSSWYATSPVLHGIYQNSDGHFMVSIQLYFLYNGKLTANGIV